MRYVFLLLLLCLTFFFLNSVSKYQSPLSFLSAGNGNSVAANGANTGHRPHTHWATAAMAPTKGGPSAGIGLSQAPQVTGDGSGADDLSADQGNALTGPATNTDAEAAIGTPSSVALAPVRPVVEVKNSPLEYSTATHSDIETSAKAAPDQRKDLAATLVTGDDNAGAASNVTPTGDAGAASDAQSMDLESEISLTPDYIDMDLAALPDVAMVQPAAGPLALSPSAAAYALRISDSIRNSLMDPHGIQFGGIAGLNWSGASASTPTDSKVSGAPLTGFTLGLFADIPLAKQLSLRPALLYSYEGFQPNVNGERVNIHMAYLDMPLDLVYHTNLLGKRFFVGAGPYAAYGLNGTYTMKGINTDMQFGNNYAAGDNARRLDFGANLMGGLLMDRNFIIGATLNYGFNNIAPSGSGTSVKTRSVGISIGYVFRNRQTTPTFTY